MQQPHVIRAGQTQGRQLLGLLLALLLLGLSIGTVAHELRHANDPAHVTCAICMLAHGQVLADGAVGVLAVVLVATLILPVFREFVFVSASDLLLAPGRAPPF